MKFKNITYAILFLFLGMKLFSQTFGNEWIVYGQKYYKIKIAKDGLYKIDSTTLANAGVPLSTINPKNIQLFHKGKEVYSYIFGEGDGALNTKDYILFYAEKNTCRDDSLYFNGTPYLSNPYYSVINDTAAVFLTWNNSTTNRRLTLNTDTTYSQSTSSPYYYKEVLSSKAGYSPGPLNFLNLSDPRYKFGEGFYENQISMDANSNSFDNLALNTSAVYTGGPQAFFTICLSGANDIGGVTPDHFIQMYYTDNAGNPVILKTDSVNGYDTHRFTFTVNPSLFGNTTTLGCTTLVDNATPIYNYTNINYMRAFVPSQFNLLGASTEKIYLPDDGSQTKSKLIISSFNGSKPFLVNVSDSTLHTVKAAGSNFLALVPNSGKTKMCYLADSLSIISVVNLSKVNGTGTFVNYQSQIADSNYLIISNPSLAAEAQNYKTFRSSVAGGSHPVILAMVNDLYDQFGFGVEISPMALRNFCAMVIAAPTKNPSNLFLLGKAIHSMDCMVGAAFGPGSFYKPKNLVPTWGNPSSDNLITQGLPGSTYIEPAIPTGRLAAQNNQEIASYLSKVNLYVQQTDDSLWKKRGLHFVGGKDYYEQQALSSYMNDFKNIFEDTAMGGHVYSFYKTTSAPTSVTTNDSVKKLIEEGVLIMTFFGHGSQTGFDQNIDDPQNYNNSPKFPLIIANSCFTGDIHSGDQQSNSELFMLAPNNKGAIGYLATVSEGIANELYYYTRAFYKQFSGLSYGQSYGACIKRGINQLMYAQTQGNFPGDSLLHWTALEMTFHGDPAIAPYTTPKPDYTLTNSDVIFNTTKWVDSIGIKIVMTNLAKAIKDSFTVLIQRNFPNGDTLKIFKRVKAPYYKDTLSFFIYKDYKLAVGLNCFYIKLDYLNLISEISETNNSTIGNVCLFIPGSDIDPVWPYKYAIVPNIANIILKASTADPFAPSTTYRFQVDTNNKFLTPLINTTVTAPGGVVSLPVTLYNSDSMVYFWRVAKDTVLNPNWKETSFQVITGKYGWGQAHFHQFKNDAYQFVVYSDTIPRSFKFVNDVKTIEVTDMVLGPWGGGYNDFPKISFYYNNAQQRLWSCEPNGWTIAIFDSITGNLKYTDTLGGAAPNPQTWIGENGNCVCDVHTKMAYDFGSRHVLCGNNPDWRTNLTNFLKDSVPMGAPVLAYAVKCWGCSSQDTLPAALINQFHSIGSTKIDSLKDSTVLIIFGRKGWTPGMAHETLGQTQQQLIRQKDSLITKYKNGFIASEIIGPCQFSDTAWHSLHWHFHNLETNSQDRIYVRLMGINSSGQKVFLTDFPKDSLNVLDLSRYASGKQYPYLQLIAFETDTILNTPPQLERWQVIYDPAAEAAIDPPSGFTIFKTKVAEGEDYKLRVPIKNISDFRFNDSLVITYVLQDANRVNHTLPYKLKNKPFLPDSIIFDTISISTLGFSGNDVLWIDVNKPGHPKYQPEQYHFNNIAQIAFTVDRDKINPLLDVTFDGVHILNGDIVSAKPNVLVSLKDENKFLALNDTSNFMVYVQYPGAITETRLFFNSALQFMPAQLPNNSCKINYKPALPQDGVYTLHVRATDRSANVSGQIDYKIQFEIVNKPTITEVLNYPNPFSTSTKFVFTITGSEVPETFKVQILTITGRVVKEITREELGFLHIGRNITEYAWDGTDQFGDKLANGVYLYRVDTRLNGKEMDHLSTAADGYFKKGYGKMLLMR